MTATNLRQYGSPPYQVAVLHGGPGAPGEMEPVARELSSDFGVLEPIQTARSVDGQVEELKGHLDHPVVIIGYSWGARLGALLAARHPECVKKLILVSSGVFDHSYASQITDSRLERMTLEEKQLFQSFSPENFSKIGKLLNKIDSFDPLPYESSDFEPQYEIFQSVWKEADHMRKTGQLLKEAKKIRCPVVVIHGDYDPHPIEGVAEPLESIITEVHILKNCGHTPWREKQAKQPFYKILRQVIDI